ncbi:MAG: metallophosphoesterase [Phycisphaerales bacterium]|nr:metallophosphoesterase [Phycisphaerales bacterium]
MNSIDPAAPRAPASPSTFADPARPDRDTLDSDATAPVAPVTRVVHPRTILLLALLIALIGVLGYAAYPYVAPPWIDEGPLVQQSTPTELTLVWFTSREAECEVRFTAADGSAQKLTTRGKRHAARLTGLKPSTFTEYSIHEGERELFQGRANTARAAGHPFTFLVFGDSGRGKSDQYTLAARMPTEKPDFLLHTGDLIYPAGERHDYKAKFFKPYAALLATVAFWPSLGNHDVAKESDAADPYREVFELPENGPAGQPPENNYWFDYADARIAVFDSNLDESTTRSVILPWLRSVFSAPHPAGGPLWRFVVMHHPVYSVGKHGDTPRIRDNLVSAFEELHIDVVFSGHDHLHERTVPMVGGRAAKDGERGVVYLVSGAGGAKLYKVLPQDKWPSYYAMVNNETHNYTVIRISGGLLKARTVSLSGSVVDEWEMAQRPIPGTDTTPATTASETGR